ncbi:ESX secretion-associated protein EspG [Nocardia carnea]|uniref:ESX secretion-associated protein EspG n=1 Tax=Nocardia carnea TaxID=37328 RepID=A0ABW7TS34_9NOCA|nr:ESX secretion-associated protein EspG [Nocardia carnea]
MTATGTGRRWAFSDIEFYTLWADATGALRLPFPFHFTARSPDPEDFRSDQRQARAALAERSDPAFEQVLDALTTPDIRVEVRGSDRRKADPDTLPTSVVRMLGVRRESAGYIVSALPGETYLHSGGFTVTECTAVQLAGEVVAKLPDMAAGSRKDMVLPRRARTAAEPAAQPRRSPTVHDSFQATESERGTAFLAEPASCTGLVRVVQGSSIYGPRGITRFEFEWRDLVGDGRYLVRDSDPPVAVAAGSKDFTATINAKIAQIVRVIKDERQGR